MPKHKSTHLYLEHFQLREAPFKITPTTEFFYGGGRRGEILHALLYALNVGEGIVMLSGEVGSGKTMMLRAMMEKLTDETETIYIANPSLSGREILYHICEELGLQAKVERSDTVRMLQNYLIEQYGKGRRVVAFIDEAQAMPDESLEEIRLLSNLETSRDKLLQIFLFGQPELEDKLSRQNMRQLNERICVKLKLQPFNREDVREYISTRLRAAGYNSKPMFSSGACHLIAVVSQGLSRRINVLADKAMLSAYGRGGLSVKFSDVRRAVKDVRFGRMRYRSEESRRISKQITIGLAAASFVVLAVAIGTRLPGADLSGSDKVVPDTAAPASIVIDSPAAETSVTPASAAVETVTTETAAKKETPANEKAATQGIATQDIAIKPATSAPLSEPDSSAAEAANSAAAAAAVNTQANATNTATGESSQRQELLSAISALNRGNETLTGEELAAELADSAVYHADDKAEVRVAAEWGIAPAAPTAVDNQQWSWMPAASYLRSRLNATQTWLQSNDTNGMHTARLLTVGRERAVFLEKFLRYFADFYPLRNLMVYPAQLDSGGKFVVTYGIYPSRGDTEVFISNLPYYFTGGRPFTQQMTDSAAEAAAQWRTTAQ